MRGRLLIVVPLLSIFLFLPAYTAAFYPPPQLPSQLGLITVHTTTVNVTGPASKNFTLDIQGQDGLSLITKLSLTLAVPLTNFSIQILQLNSLPPGIANIGGGPVLPSGKPLLYFYFNIDSAVQSQISQADFYLRVPATELQLFSANPTQVIIQKYLYSWSTQTSYLNNTVIEDYGAQYYIYRVFSTSELTLYAVTDKEAFALSPESLLSAGIVITVATLLVLLRMRSKRRDLAAAENLKA
jgi:hypothetical protein